MSSILDQKDEEEKEDARRRDGGPNQTYAGGNSAQGGGSGQNVVHPDDIFQRAMQSHGAEHHAEFARRVAEREREQSKFTGRARRINEDPNAPQSEPEAVEEAPAAPERVEHVITFWRNGFTIDEGELRDPKVPENAAILEALNRGMVPVSLGFGVDPLVSLKDMRGKDYKPPSAVEKPFQGTGHKIGGARASDVPVGESEPEAPAVDES